MIKGRFKKLKIALIVMMSVVLFVGISFGSYVLFVNFSPVKITLSKQDAKQTIYGWGTSSCWWAQMIDDDSVRDDVISLLYGDDGLALNIYRYNVGGGTAENERIGNPWRRTESFYVYDDASNEWKLDFSRDANAQKSLFKALELGNVDTVVLFANSPHFSMTESGLSSGGYTAHTSNLRKDKYEEYVDYFLDITEYFISKGVPVKFISPVNEPENSWGGDWVGQEGCYYEVEEIVQLFRLFAIKIKERGLDVKLSGAEACNIDNTGREYYDALMNDEEIRECLGSYSFHSYGGDDKIKGWLSKDSFGNWLDKKAPENLRLDMSEWCELPCQNDVDDVNCALIMARVMARDVSLIGVNSWTSWVAVNQKGGENGKDFADGMITATDDFSWYKRTRRYYAMAHFSKFIPFGSKTLDIDCNIPFAKNLSHCAFLTPTGEIVLVIVNEGDDRQYTINAQATKMSIYQTAGDSNLAEVYKGDYNNIITIPSKSISTIVLK